MIVYGYGVWGGEKENIKLDRDNGCTISELTKNNELYSSRG